MADNGGKGRLIEKEVLLVVRQLNENIPESVIRQRFKVGTMYPRFRSQQCNLMYNMMSSLSRDCTMSPVIICTCDVS